MDGNEFVFIEKLIVVNLKLLMLLDHSSLLPLKTLID